MKLNEIKEITTKVEHGAWVRNLPNLPDVAVKVRGRFNADAARLMAEEASKLTKSQRENPEVTEELEVKVYVETILLDWEGIDDTPYSKEAAQQLLSDPAYAVFRRAVDFASSIVGREGQESLESAAKN